MTPSATNRRLSGRLAAAPAPALVLTLVLALAACGGDEPVPGIAEERWAPDEAEVTRELIGLTKAATRAAREAAHDDGATSPPMTRFNQPRHAGCVAARFTVPAGLPDDLRVGLFAEPATWPAWIRFASASRDPDTEKDFRGMSIKLMDVQGKKLLGEGDTHDFLLNSHPALFVGTPEDFRDFVETSLDSNPAWFFLNPLDPHLRELMIVRAGRQHHPSHLAIPYWSTTPYLFGEGRAVKYSARPCAGEPVPALPDPLTDGYLRDAMREQLSTGGACFDFMVQFQVDAEAMPIEDAAVEWDESESPFRAVAKIEIPPQSFESPDQMAFCESLAFNPWRSLPEHRPLGGINRVRRELYDTLAAFRHDANSVRYSEPSADTNFPLTDGPRGEGNGRP